MTDDVELPANSGWTAEMIIHMTTRALLEAAPQIPEELARGVFEGLWNVAYNNGRASAFRESR